MSTSNILHSYLRGDLSSEKYAYFCQHYSIKRQLILFVSSTFTDTHQERTLLHEKILPILQDKASLLDIQVILYDMRFGIKDDNTLNHLTWTSCKEAISHCYEKSDGLFFLSLQGDKYGYTPLPKDINETIFDQHLSNAASYSSSAFAADAVEDLISLAKVSYRRDENAVPCHYELKPLTADNSEEYWKSVFPRLVSFFRDVAFESFDNITGDNNSDKLEITSKSSDARDASTIIKNSLMVNHSITEWETLFALHLDEQRCFWVSRHFQEAELLRLLQEEKERKAAQISSDSDQMQKKDRRAVYDDLCDTFNQPEKLHQLDQLKSTLSTHLSPYNRIASFPDISPAAYVKQGIHNNISNKEMEGDSSNSKDTEIDDYFKSWKDQVQNLLFTEIDKLQHFNQSFKEEIAKKFFGIPFHYFEEFVFHNDFAMRKSSSFYGRETLVAKILDFIVTKRRNASNEDLFIAQMDENQTVLTLKQELSVKSSNEKDDVELFYDEISFYKRASSLYKTTHIRQSQTQKQERLFEKGDKDNHKTRKKSTKESESDDDEEWESMEDDYEQGKEKEEKAEEEEQEKDPLNSPLSGITCALIGKSGYGKTSLMSKLAILAYNHFQHEQTLFQQQRYYTNTGDVPKEMNSIPMIIRFCGTSALSLHAIDLMNSIALQLLCIYQQKDELNAYKENFKMSSSTTSSNKVYRETIKAFHSVLYKYPVLLFIDSLDQLSDMHEARSELNFLKGLTLTKLPSQTRIIVSSLPD